MSRTGFACGPGRGGEHRCGLRDHRDLWSVSKRPEPPGLISERTIVGYAGHEFCCPGVIQ